MALKSKRPSEIGTTIKAELKTSKVIHATTSKRTIRSTKPYLLNSITLSIILIPKVRGSGKQAFSI